VQDAESLADIPTVTLPAEIDRFFGADALLLEDLPFRWTRGLASRVQTAFAREGLVVRIPLEEDSGSAVCLAGRDGDSDLCRIARSFRRLEELGYIAEPDFSLTTSSGWEDIHQNSHGDEIKTIFWNSQAHVDCFDDEGTLVDDIPMQWAGDAGVIEEALGTTDLTVETPENTEITFYLGPAGDEGEDGF
jgi:hypothetical protein